MHVSGERAAEHFKRFVSVHNEHTITGCGLPEDMVARAIELSETKCSPAMASLRPGAAITSGYVIVEAGPDTMAE